MAESWLSHFFICAELYFVQRFNCAGSFHRPSSVPLPPGGRLRDQRKPLWLFSDYSFDLNH